jgi:hypothetical protein
MCHRGAERKPTIIRSHVKSAEIWELDRATGAANEVCMGRKASNQSAVKECLIHLLMDVGSTILVPHWPEEPNGGIEPLMVKRGAMNEPLDDWGDL